MNKKIILLLIVIIAIASLAYIIRMSSTVDEEEIKTEILNELGLETADIIKLENINELKEEYPIIYKEARAGDYRIRTSSALIIYNYENKEIIKRFDVSHITVGDGA